MTSSSPPGVEHDRFSRHQRHVLPGNHVVPDENPVRRKTEPGVQVALGRGDEHVGRDERPPRLPVRDVGNDQRHGGCARSPVAAVHDPRDGKAVHAVVTGGALTEEVAAGADQPVIVQGRHYRHPGVPAGVQDRGAEQGKGVVHVHDVGPVPAQRRGQVAAGPAAPDHPGRQRRLLRRRPVLDLIAVSAEPHDLVPGAGERLALPVDDEVLPARHGRAVPVVDLQDPHPRLRSGAGGTSSDAAKASSSRYIEASLSPVSVNEVTRRYITRNRARARRSPRGWK